MRKTCRVEGCEQSRKQGGLCIEHNGSLSKMVSVEEYGEQRGEGGKTEGGEKATKKCKVELSDEQGPHGAAVKNVVGEEYEKKQVERRTKKKAGCKIEGCERQAVQAGVCISHGAVVKRCDVEGCGKYRHKQGMCCAHFGAVAKMCSVKGCGNQKKGGGVCEAHLRSRNYSSLKSSSSSRSSSSGSVKGAEDGGVRATAAAVVNKAAALVKNGREGRAGGDEQAYTRSDLKGKRCIERGCDKYKQSGYGGRCKRHAKLRREQLQQGCISSSVEGVAHPAAAAVLKKGRAGGEPTSPLQSDKMCIEIDCDKFRQTGCGGRCKRHARMVREQIKKDAELADFTAALEWDFICSEEEEEESDDNRPPRRAVNKNKNKKRKRCSKDGCEKFRQSNCEEMCRRHHTLEQEGAQKRGAATDINERGAKRAKLPSLAVEEEEEGEEEDDDEDEEENEEGEEEDREDNREKSGVGLIAGLGLHVGDEIQLPVGLWRELEGGGADAATADLEGGEEELSHGVVVALGQTKVYLLPHYAVRTKRKGASVKSVIRDFVSAYNRYRSGGGGEDGDDDEEQKEEWELLEERMVKASENKKRGRRALRSCVRVEGPAAWD